MRIGSTRTSFPCHKLILHFFTWFHFDYYLFIACRIDYYPCIKMKRFSIPIFVRCYGLTLTIMNSWKGASHLTLTKIFQILRLLVSKVGFLFFYYNYLHSTYYTSAYVVRKQCRLDFNVHTCSHNLQINGLIC